MNNFNIFSSTFTIISAIAVLLSGWVIVDLLQINVSELLVQYLYKPLRRGLFTSEALAKFNGIDEKLIYLGILGSVFDVTKGAQHYSKTGSYHYFAGKDGSRSFVTGDFGNDSQDSDHVIDLSCEEIESIKSWENTFKKKYIYKGKLIGRYYDEQGKPTDYSKQLEFKLNKCKEDALASREFNKRYPPCNIEWDADKGTRVWCTKDSGGVKRSWAGVPRQLYTPGDKTPSCVCLDLSADYSDAMIKQYQNCSHSSVTCYVKE